MEEIIEKLTAVFKNSLPDDEIDLANAYKTYLEEEAKKIKASKIKIAQIDENLIRGVLYMITQDMIHYDLQTKKKMIIKDENMERIRQISAESFEQATKVLNGQATDEYDAKKYLKEIQKLHSRVKDFNQDEAKRIVSETVLDLNYIENPQSDFTSLRLGHIIMQAKREKEKNEAQNKK